MQSKTKTILWTTGGIFFLIAGIFLLGYSGYIVSQKKESQKISEILPFQDLEFIVFKNTYTTQKEEQRFLGPLLSPLFTNMKKGAVAVYPNNTFIQIEKNTDEQQTKLNLYCEVAKGYQFCSSLDKKEGILSLIDNIQKNSPVLAEFSAFQEAERRKTVQPDTGVDIFGKTSFAVEMFWKEAKNFIPEDMQEGVLTSLSRIQENSPYISGNIQSEDFSLFLLKQESNTIFQQDISQYDISEYFIHPSADRYFFSKKPKILWDTLFSSFSEKDLSTAFVTKKVLRESFSTFFSHNENQGKISLDFKKDILPLFEGDILWAENPKGSMIIYSLPKKSITSEVFQKFSTTVEQIAQWSIPLKLGHTLKDGSTIYEVFPNTENISIQKSEDKNGKKIIFSNNEAKKSLGVVQQDTFLMISNETQFLDHFWNLSGGKFIFPLFAEHSQETFLSLGFSQRETENTPFRFIEISGKEYPEYFEISGNMKWNTIFFTPEKSKPEENKNEGKNGETQNREKSEKPKEGNTEVTLEQIPE